MTSDFSSEYIYSNRLKILIQKNIFTLMFIAVLFTIVKIWKQSKYPSIDEWIKNTVEY